MPTGSFALNVLCKYTGIIVGCLDKYDLDKTVLNKLVHEVRAKMLVVTFSVMNIAPTLLTCTVTGILSGIFINSRIKATNPVSND